MALHLENKRRNSVSQTIFRLERRKNGSQKDPTTWIPHAIRY